MSLPIAQVSCTGCDFRKGLLPARVKLEYLMSNGERIQAGCTIGWCYSCNTVVKMEKADLKELATDIARLETRLAEYCAIQERDQYYKENWLSISSLIDWLRNDLDKAKKLSSAIATRKSPARCMSCWGADVIRLRFNDGGLCESIEHSCGGQFKYDDGDGGVRVSCREARLLLDIEGHPLESEG